MRPPGFEGQRCRWVGGESAEEHRHSLIASRQWASRAAYVNWAAVSGRLAQSDVCKRCEKTSADEEKRSCNSYLMLLVQRRPQYLVASLREWQLTALGIHWGARTPPHHHTERYERVLSIKSSPPSKDFTILESSKIPRIHSNAAEKHPDEIMLVLLIIKWSYNIAITPRGGTQLCDVTVVEVPGNFDRSRARKECSQHLYGCRGVIFVRW